MASVIDHNDVYENRREGMKLNGVVRKDGVWIVNPPSSVLPGSRTYQEWRTV